MEPRNDHPCITVSLLPQILGDIFPTYQQLGGQHYHIDVKRVLFQTWKSNRKRARTDPLFGLAQRREHVRHQQCRSWTSARIHQDCRAPTTTCSPFLWYVQPTNDGGTSWVKKMNVDRRLLMPTQRKEQTVSVSQTSSQTGVTCEEHCTGRGGKRNVRRRFGRTDPHLHTWTNSSHTRRHPRTSLRMRPAAQQARTGHIRHPVFYASLHVRAFLLHGKGSGIAQTHRQVSCGQAAVCLAVPRAEGTNKDRGLHRRGLGIERG